MLLPLFINKLFMRSVDINIPTDTPFENCKLDRKQYAEVLTSIVKAYDNGFVLAVNGKWGTGKTTFMKMWEQSLKNDGYKTIFFNAWESDFTSEPMVAILGEIKGLVNADNKVKFDSILDKASKLSLKLIPTLAKTVVSLAGLGGIADVVEKASEIASNALKDEIDGYGKQKESLQAIRRDLANFVKDSCGGKPLVFIVDELDRCRPDYAVEVLEKIKHLFAVDGVVFVLSIDKEQLSHAICGYYGSEKIDSAEYLRRFIDLEYTLPKPDYKCYVRHLYDLKEISNIPGIYNNQDKTQVDHLINIVGHFCDNEKFTLRQLDKIFSHAKIVARSFAFSNIHFEVVILLIIIKEYRFALYEEFKNNKNTLQQITSLLEVEFSAHLIKQKSFDPHPEYFLYTVVRIIELFNNDKPHREDLTKGGRFTISFPTAENITKNNPHIFSYIEEIYVSVSLSSYTTKIDLLEQLKL